MHIELGKEMSENLDNLENIREYLLGQISDETKLEGIEELLFSDDEFCTKVEIIEDELINDFVFGKLNKSDLVDFETTLANNADRRLKVQVTQQLKLKTKAVLTEQRSSIFESIVAFFRQPMYAGTFALLLIACIIGGIFLLRSNNSVELASLKNIYQKERPIEPRISGFDYAPLNITRGENKDNPNKNKLEEIKLELLKEVNSNPNAENFYGLGVFNLTQQSYKDAIENLEKAVKLDDKNASFHNDLGSAYYEFAKSKDEKKFENLTSANEAFSKAFQLNPNLLEALFNRSLALQELGLTERAKESWQKYLERDSTSKWAQEAKKNMEKLAATSSVGKKTAEDVSNDFFAAYRDRNEKLVLNIHNSTKGTFGSLSLSDILTRLYLEAKKNGNEITAKESIEALTYISKLEKEKYADFFFADLAEYYEKLDVSKADEIIKAKDLIKEGIDLMRKSRYTESINSFEKAKNIFSKNGNSVEELVGEVWAAQMLRDVGKNDEAISRLTQLAKTSELRNYKVLLSIAFEWLSNVELGRNIVSKAIYYSNRSLKVAEESENIYSIRQHIVVSISNYLDLGENAKASELINKSHAYGETYYQNLSQVWRYNLFATKLVRMNGNYATSVEFGKESLSIARQNLPIEAINNSIRELTKSLIENKDFEEATKLADESVQTASVMPDSDEKSLILADSFLHRANIKRQAENCTDALSDYNQSLELYSKKSETLYNLYEIHSGKLLCFRSLHRKQDFVDEFIIVSKFSENYRQNIREDDSRQAFFDNQQFIYDAAISNSLEKNDKQKAFEFLETSKARSLLEFVKSEKSITETEGDFANYTKPSTLAEIQSRIPENVQILEYAVLPNKLAIWLIKKNGFELIEKPIENSAFDEKLNNYRRLIIGKDQNAQAIASELFQLLIPQNLEQNKTLCIVADKSLYQIPFASLQSAEGKYLIEEFPIIYSPSSSVFLTLTENSRLKNVDESILSVGNPKFNSQENSDLSDLPEAETEVFEIAKNYIKSTNIIGDKATKLGFIESFDKAEIIHFAGHFVTNEQFSGNSKMLFADSNLSSAELSEIRIPKAKMVILSACDTGFEKMNKSEGSIGIARTFLAMGSPLVVASNWKVDSEATKSLMISFHKHRKQGKLSSLKALQQSQIEMLKSNNFGSPYYWSAFSINGGAANY
jgi:CHAT domain-containing protein